MVHALITGIIDLQYEMGKIMHVPEDNPYTIYVMSLEYVSL
jgi:hypothetical protein